MGHVNRANPRYLAPFVCIDCRRSFKRPWIKGITHRPCPACGKPAVGVSQKFKPPRAVDDEQWDKVRPLICHGFLFHSIYNDSHELVRYPDSLREARAWVKKWEHMSAAGVVARQSRA